MVYIPPSFDNLVNDLTGNSATLTITPPNDVGYVQTNIFYRRITGPNGIPESTWSSGGIYIGAAGVQGLHQVSGLQVDQLYEFILTAESAADYSPPSMARRVVISVNVEPVHLRILENIATWLRSITKVDGYNFDIRQVKTIRTPGQAGLDEYPGAVVYEATEERNDTHPIGATTNHMIIYVEGWFQSYENVDIEIERWRADLEIALLQDRRRGGDAITTHIRAVQKAASEGAEPFGGIFLELDVHYRTDFGNPYQRR